MDLAQEFSNLHATIKRAGLLKKCPQYSDMLIIRTIGMLVLVIASAILIQKISDRFFLQIPVALALGFVFGQCAFLAHDIGHEQIVSNLFPAVFLRYFLNVSLFGSLTGWKEKHNFHHQEPNNIALDPDCDIPMLAFTTAQAHEKRGPSRFLVRYQPYLFVPIASFTSISIRFTGIQGLLRSKHPNTVLELALIGISICGYGALWVSLFGVSKAVLFAALTEGTFGLYMGMVFATNHFGRSFEPTIETDFLTKQVITSRNVGSSRKFLDACIHFFYGGLNRQIEHHLWSYMPRCHLKHAEKIVRERCMNLGIDHSVVSPLRAYQEIFSNFATISKSIRERTR